MFELKYSSCSYEMFHKDATLHESTHSRRSECVIFWVEKCPSAAKLHFWWNSHSYNAPRACCVATTRPLAKFPCWRNARAHVPRIEWPGWGQCQVFQPYIDAICWKAFRASDSVFGLSASFARLAFESLITVARICISTLCSRQQKYSINRNTLMN